MRIPIFIAQHLINSDPIPKTPATPHTLGKILGLAFLIIGSIAFLMLVITGFRYVVSQGEPTKTAELRRQIAYIVGGLIIVASAYAIVAFVTRSAG
jgi:uncharacterized membrane protein YidH (DUF202 family)